MWKVLLLPAFAIACTGGSGDAGGASIDAGAMDAMGADAAHPCDPEGSWTVHLLYGAGGCVAENSTDEISFEVTRQGDELAVTADYDPPQVDYVAEVSAGVAGETCVLALVEFTPDLIRNGGSRRATGSYSLVSGPDGAILGHGRLIVVGDFECTQSYSVTGSRSP